jgi:hypothetical protein
MTAPSYLSIAFIVLIVGLIILISMGLNSGRKKAGFGPRSVILFIIGSFIWLGATGLVTASGILEDWSALPPRFPFLLIIPILVMTILLKNKKFNQILVHIPTQWPVALQSFRIVMELILLGLFLESVIPQQMSFEGWNFDVAAGILAIPIAWRIWRNKATKAEIKTYNIVGLVLLTTIVIIAVLSTPAPFRQFMNEPANTVIIYLPFIWLPAFVVPVAYFMHFVSLRQLKASK